MICNEDKNPVSEQARLFRACGEQQNKPVQFYYTHLGVWVMFLLIGPGNLYFVWRSPLMGKTAKVIHSVFTILISVALVYIIYVLLVYIFNLYNAYLNINY
jgi:hypothetical protein